MRDIEELQGRIASALDRIGQGLERSQEQGRGADPAELEALRQELDDERMANEQMKERVKALRTRREEMEAELEAARGAASESTAALDHELQGLRAANEKLREINARLREANAVGVAEPHLINKAMMAELDGLRAARAADRAETEAICSALSGALEGAVAEQVAEQTEGS